MKTGQAGIDLIKKFEGLRLEAYPDPATGGEPFTIGYGTTSSAGVGKISRGMKITQVQAESMLVRSLDGYEIGVMRNLAKAPAQHQFDAMVSLAYNIGLGNFGKSTVVKAFNAGDNHRAADAFLMWTKAAGKTLPGLVARRNAERALFLKPDTVPSAAPAGATQAP